MLPMSLVQVLVERVEFEKMALCRTYTSGEEVEFPLEEGPSGMCIAGGEETEVPNLLLQKSLKRPAAQSHQSSTTRRRVRFRCNTKMPGSPAAPISPAAAAVALTEQNNAAGRGEGNAQGERDGDEDGRQDAEADQAKPPSVSKPKRKARSLWVTKQAVQEFGASPACLGCKALLNAATFRKPHTQECKARMREELMKTEDGKARVLRAQERMSAH